MAPTSSTFRADVVLVGGGLANSLIALRSEGSASRPQRRDDRARASNRRRAHLVPLRDRRQPGRQRLAASVDRPPLGGIRGAFPGHQRSLETPYLAITSKRLHEAVIAALGKNVWLGRVGLRTSRRIRSPMADGRRIAAARHRRARSASQPKPGAGLADLPRPGSEARRAARPARPIIMDASVEQQGGYRFVYVLPFDATRLLIEDTHYVDGDASTTPTCAPTSPPMPARGWRIAKVLREEHGSAADRAGRRLRRLLARPGPGQPSVGLRAGPVPLDHRLLAAARGAPGRPHRRMPAPRTSAHVRAAPRPKRRPLAQASASSAC
jgi:lycopene beta-cyclase